MIKGELSADVLEEEDGEYVDLEKELLMPDDMDDLVDADDFDDGENWQERIIELSRVTKVRLRAKDAHGIGELQSLGGKADTWLAQGLEPRVVVIGALCPPVVRCVPQVVKGGKLMGFRCTAIIGNGNGLVGVGCQAGREVATAVKRALVDAKKSVVRVSGPGVRFRRDVQPVASSAACACATCNNGASARVLQGLLTLYLTAFTALPLPAGHKPCPTSPESTGAPGRCRHHPPPRGGQVQRRPLRHGARRRRYRCAGWLLHPLRAGAGWRAERAGQAHWLPQPAEQRPLRRGRPGAAAHPPRGQQGPRRAHGPPAAAQQQVSGQQRSLESSCCVLRSRRFWRPAGRTSDSVAWALATAAAAARGSARQQFLAFDGMRWVWRGAGKPRDWAQQLRALFPVQLAGSPDMGHDCSGSQNAALGLGGGGHSVCAPQSCAAAE